MKRTWPMILATAALAGSAVLTMRAQPPATPRPSQDALSLSVQDALNRPFHFTFAKPTPLDEVAREMSRVLKAPVVVDRAAVERLGLKTDDEVRLELEGVRLRTGLKLLLDQLDMTYRVVPEDNLLIFTDSSGADEPLAQVVTELKSLHRDLHDVQDAIDDIRDALGLDDGGPRMRKPTIIEEVPGERVRPADPKDEPPALQPPARTRPGA